MIFVTVGTHEQPFSRLWLEVERLWTAGHVPDLYCQTGYTREALPSGIPQSAFLDYETFTSQIEDASIVITHGGPGSVLPALSLGKPLVIVPRQSSFGEHVDDHQVSFARRVADTHACGVVIEIEDLLAAIRKAQGGRQRAEAQIADPEKAVARLGEAIAEVKRGRPRRAWSRVGR